MTSGYRWLDRYRSGRTEYPQAIPEMVMAAEGFLAVVREMEKRERISAG